MRDLIILGAYLLIVTGLIQWIIYYTYKSIQTIREAREAYKEYKKAEKACEDYMKDLDANNERVIKAKTNLTILFNKGCADAIENVKLTIDRII